MKINVPSENTCICSDQRALVYSVINTLEKQLVYMNMAWNALMSVYIGCKSNLIMLIVPI